MAHKQVYMIGGANGAGKTTTALMLLPQFLSMNEFVNADEIAKGLSPLSPSSMAITAGRLMIERIAHLTTEGKDFAFETTCSGKRHVHTLEKCRAHGYKLNLIYLWLPSAEMAVYRVRSRIREGGHAIPEEVIHRRYSAGLKNLLTLYLPLCDNVVIYDNSYHLGNTSALTVIAEKINNKTLNIIQPERWNAIEGYKQA